MHRILLPLLLLPLLLLNASFASVGDERFESAFLVGSVVEVFDAIEVSGPSIEGDDGAPLKPSFSQPSLPLQPSLQLPVPTDFLTLHHADLPLIRAPPACIV